MKILPRRTSAARRWGIVLSGGDGVRLRDFVYRRRGDYLPKQYINFIGTRSMLEHTLDRAEKLIAPQRLLLVIGAEHLRFDEVRRQVSARAQGCVLVQPKNKDTAPGVLLPLIHVYKRDPEAAVAIFPSDHYILEENLFMRHVEGAFESVEAERSCIVLLGIEPSEPDPEYGYIVPGGAKGSSKWDNRAVEMFVEKPSALAARSLMASGALWSTLVVVASCKTLLQAIERATPELYRSFEPLRTAIGSPVEDRVTKDVYEKLPAVNFSKCVLETLSPEHRRALIVHRVRGVTWSDWGTSVRLSRTLQQLARANFIAQGHDAGEKSTAVMPEGQLGTAIERMRDVSR